MRKLLTLFLCLVLTCSPVFAATSQLAVDAANHFLEDAEGNIVFLLADTQWQIKTLSPSQVDTMLQDRKDKGCNAFWMSIHPEGRDYNGNYPFTAEGDGDWEPDSRVAAFWAHVDYIVEAADDFDMYVIFIVLWTYGESQTFVRTGDYENFTDAISQIGHFIDEVYQMKRIHSSLGYLTPLEFEELYWHSQVEQMSSLKIA